MIRRACNVLALVIMSGCAGAWLALPDPAYTRLQAAALQCARALDAPTDINIVRCYTSRGLPVPGDL